MLTLKLGLNLIFWTCYLKHTTIFAFALEFGLLWALNKNIDLETI